MGDISKKKAVANTLLPAKKYLKKEKKRHNEGSKKRMIEIYEAFCTVKSHGVNPYQERQYSKFGC
jgi:hypothetical protein